MGNKLPKSINLLDPVNRPEDIWERIYDWLFNVGKYILISVEVLVLIVFFSRFAIDRMNNNLTDDINDQVNTLSNDFFRRSEIRFNNLHALLLDLNTLSNDQKKNSTIVSSITESIPSNIKLEQFSFTRGQVNMSFTANDFESIQSYESLLRRNPKYSDVRINLSKSGESTSKIDFTVSFNIIEEDV